jgi:hypothetical protein
LISECTILIKRLWFVVTPFIYLFENVFILSEYWEIDNNIISRNKVGQCTSETLDYMERRVPDVINVIPHKYPLI